jgi:hypothetical protein
VRVPKLVCVSIYICVYIYILCIYTYIVYCERRKGGTWVCQSWCVCLFSYVFIDTYYICIHTSCVVREESGTCECANAGICVYFHVCLYPWKFYHVCG